MDHQYRMTVDLNVIEHLGINLYSNIAAVLTEAVANAWDADAKKVSISVDQDAKQIQIDDNGIGMSIEDINNKYLRVGYQRRKEDHKHGQYTAKGRKVMGRKGLGKLSLFSIANIIEVQSKKNGHRHGFRMTVDGIRDSVRKNEPYYSPESIQEAELSVNQGTRIVLREIKRQRLGQGANALRKRLARRFSVIGEKHGFSITINEKPITMADRGDLAVTQFLWTIGNYSPEKGDTPKKLEQEFLPSRLETWDEDWNVDGWIGTARHPKHLDDLDAGILNGIVVVARGRLIHENILESINDSRLFTKYITGQIEADFLDSDKPEESDIATSDRQRVQEDDPRYEQLVALLRSNLAKVKTRWDQWRIKHEVKEAQETSPALTEWFESLPTGFRDNATTLIAKLSALPMDQEEDRKLLYRHGILAFERMRLRGSVTMLVSQIDSVDKLLILLGNRDDLEASMYRDIVRSRLEAIKEFQNVVDENAKEKILQKYLFDHLWLLDPAWERATGSELMESRLLAEGVLTDNMTEKEKLGRVDIAYRTNAGKHIIVELKRNKRKMKLLDLQDQGQTYVDKLKKILVQHSELNPNIEVVFVLGEPVSEESENPERVKNSMAAVSPGSRIVHYDALIQSALDSYNEYLESSANLDALDKIVDRI